MFKIPYIAKTLRQLVTSLTRKGQLEQGQLEQDQNSFCFIESSFNYLKNVIVCRKRFFFLNYFNFLAKIFFFR